MSPLSQPPGSLNPRVLVLVVETRHLFYSCFRCNRRLLSFPARSSIPALPAAPDHPLFASTGPEAVPSHAPGMTDASRDAGPKQPAPTRPEKPAADFGYVGIDAILEQMRRKAMKQGFEFNIMVVGEFFSLHQLPATCSASRFCSSAMMFVLSGASSGAAAWVQHRGLCLRGQQTPLPRSWLEFSCR